MNIEDHILAAIEQEVFSFAMSCHAPVPATTKWNMKEQDLGTYIDELKRLRSKYRNQIEVYTSLEIDYIPGYVEPRHALFQSQDLDFTIGSVHCLGDAKRGLLWEMDGSHKGFQACLRHFYDGDSKKLVNDYFKVTRHMIRTFNPDIVGHFDKIRMQNINGEIWDEKSTWYKSEIMDTLDAFRQSGTIVEINTRGIYKKVTDEPYPAVWILNLIKELEIPICINSDAHHPSEVTAEIAPTAQLLKSIGFEYLSHFNGSKWQQVPFDEHGLINYQ
jgi:histidinol-phosphatase (PHP family)